MCGILGTINRPFSAATLDLLRHRGPDDCGISQMVVGHHLVCLGHRRLSILDLSAAGRQPMRTSSEKHAIVYNGEIYNHEDLRSGAPSAQYRGHSDTETILHHLAYYGCMSVRQFNGIFAFGFVDADNHKLFLARDPFGVKPLYYSADQDWFVFSSEIRALREFVDDSIDPESLAELLRLRYLPAPDTLFKSIRKVRPGHIVEVDLSKSDLPFREYPFVRGAACHLKGWSHDEALEQYTFLLNRAVRRQMLSDVEIGVLLSGGIDSALVAAIAQDHSPQRLKAFTIGFTGQEQTDEIEQAAGTACSLGLEHHTVKISSRDFFDGLPRIMRAIEEPIATTSVIPMFYLCSLASGHVKVVLSGQGADEAMGGYRRYQAELLRNYVPRFVVPWLRDGARALHLRADGVLRALNTIDERDDVRRFEATYAVFESQDIQRLTGETPARAIERIRYFFDLLGCARQHHSVERMMSLDLRMNLADDLLLYTDKISMQHSLECRVPLLDLELIHFVETLPRKYRIRLLRRKVLHKDAARRRLPTSIVGRKKKGFLSPAGNWLKSSTVRDLLLDPTSRFSSYFDCKEVEKVLNEHSTGFNRERHLFLLLSVYYWMAACSKGGATLDPSVIPARA
jgi:asparagine synthase (glutamine-hydrolysing)